MKKIFLLLASLSLVLTLFGCSKHEHSWVEATCENPKMCSECGETEGEALGHDWIEATCTEPQKCSKCGKEGNPALGHTVSE